MFGLGTWELILILLIILVIFGAGKLPEIGANLGKGIKNFRKSVQETKDALPDQEKAESRGEEEKGA
jgi:sec-independent protein translocase protein TatA